MRITGKFIFLLSVMIGLFLTTYVLYIRIENRRLAKFAEEQNIYQKENFTKILNLIGKPMETWAFDYSWWDDTVEFVQTVDLTWAEKNLDPSLSTFSATDYWVYNADYSYVHSGNDREDESLKELPVPAGIIPELFRVGPLCHFYVYTPLGLMEIRGGAIVKGDDPEHAGHRYGYFFTGRLWTEKHIDEIAAVTHSDIQILPMEGGAAILWDDDSRSTISFQEQLMGWDGTPVAVILVQSEVPGFKKFYEVTKQLFILFLPFMVVTLALFVLFSRFWITKPLGLISRSLSAQDPESIKDLTRRKTEFGNIARLIEQFYVQKKDLMNEIAKRKMIAEELEREKNLAEEYLNIVGVMMVSLNARQEVVMINKRGCEILGYKEEEIVGKNWFAHFIPKRTREEVSSIFDRLMKGKVKPVEYFENSALTRNGTERIIAWHNTLLKNKKGEIFTLSSGDDITERRAAEKAREALERQLQQSEKIRSIGVMANGIAHNFNNILAVIRGRIDMALKEVSPDSLPHTDLVKAIEGIVEAKALSDRMLMFGHKEEKTDKILEIPTLLEEAIELFKGSLTVPIEIRRNIDADCGPVLINPNEMKHVVMNLCINSYHALPKTGGFIEISLDEIEVNSALASKHLNLYEGRYARLIVADNGHGMNAEIIPRIFEPFFTTKKVGKGTGLGLSIVHGIIMASRGEIAVESSPGKGAKFTIYLPIFDDTMEKKV